jgi:hypothetical protein
MSPREYPTPSMARVNGQERERRPLSEVPQSVDRWSLAYAIRLARPIFCAG